MRLHGARPSAKMDTQPRIETHSMPSARAVRVTVDFITWISARCKVGAWVSQWWRELRLQGINHPLHGNMIKTGCLPLCHPYHKLRPGESAWEKEGEPLESLSVASDRLLFFRPKKGSTKEGRPEGGWEGEANFLSPSVCCHDRTGNCSQERREGERAGEEEGREGRREGRQAARQQDMAGRKLFPMSMCRPPARQQPCACMPLSSFPTWHNIGRAWF